MLCNGLRDATSALVSGSSHERRFHQLATAAVLGLGLFMAWAAAAPWIVTLGAALTLAGAVSPRLSLTRALHRWLVAPLAEKPAEPEDQHDYAAADAAIGTTAFAGAVLAIAGAYPAGWVLIGIAMASLLLDALLDWSPFRAVIVSARRRRRG